MSKPFRFRRFEITYPIEFLKNDQTYIERKIKQKKVRIGTFFKLFSKIYTVLEIFAEAKKASRLIYAPMSAQFQS
jgi:hypothetical protein